MQPESRRWFLKSAGASIGAFLGQTTPEEELKSFVAELEETHENGAPKELVIERAEVIFSGTSEDLIIKLKRNGKIYEPWNDYLRAA